MSQPLHEPPTTILSEADVDTQIAQLAGQARAASRHLARANSDQRDQALQGIATALWEGRADILDANRQDVQAARPRLTEALVDRLALDETRIEQITQAVRQIAALPTPLGQTRWGRTLSNGLTVQQVSVPVGVVAMIYEARPNVTVDAAALAFKTANAVLLRGGSAALHTNQALVQVMRQAVAQAGFAPEVIVSVDHLERAGVGGLLRARGLIDLAIPRGGESLIQKVVQEAKVPVIETGVGNCHVYVDASADLQKAKNIVINAKTQRLGVCNAAETLLVHQDVASQFLPQILPELWQRGITIHGCERTLELGSGLGNKDEQNPGGRLVGAAQQDWAEEYLGPHLAVRVVKDVAQAVEHITRYSTGHTEAIIAYCLPTVQYFTAEVDSAVVAVNASTRFTDGAQLGMGAEIGISTQKLHARGPMGLEALTTTKILLTGDGHIRE